VSAPVISFEGVWKSYPRWPAGTRTMRAMLGRRMPGVVRGGEARWALRDISLTAARGESIGLVGHNGAGKSTLLRLASGLSRPTRGSLRLPDDTASVLSLGESFDLSLTGRENAHTAAAIAGMRRDEIRAAMPRFLEFAELEAFADSPMRTYSEGMKLRLAFGVVAQLRPAALLLDEVIAVGDAHFQAKCMARIREMREEGTTLVLASHGLEEVEAECDRVVWLQSGSVRASGEAAAIVTRYRDAMRSDTLDRTPSAAGDGDGDGGLELRRTRFGSQELTIEDVALRGADGATTGEVTTGGTLAVEFAVRNHGSPVRAPMLTVSVHRAEDGVVCVDLNSPADALPLGTVEEGAEVVCTIERLDLEPGEYFVDVGVYDPDGAYGYDFHWAAYPLRITGVMIGKGLVRPPHRWGLRG